jgi:hypothetical protein
VAKIYRTTDRIKFKIGDVQISISPLSVFEKSKITQLMMDAQENKSIQLITDASLYALKVCLKDLKGVTDYEGNEYRLEFEGNELTQQCAEDLLNLDNSSKLIELCTSFINGVKLDNLPEGVSLIPNVSVIQSA